MSPSILSSNAGAVDAARWRKWPLILAVAGFVVGLIGFFVNGSKSFAYSYLFGYIFALSLCLGSLFLVLIHHLFDAGWSVPLRRVAENIACLLFPTMFILWIPIGLLATDIYPWMTKSPPDHALAAKQLLLNKPMWFAVSAGIFLIWGLLTRRLRYWSVKQDESGAAQCTYNMRFHAGWGIFAFAFTLTFGVILWVKCIEYEWFSTMYGVYYFAESVWTALATLYALMVFLKKKGPLASVVTHRQVHDMGVLWFAFTVFYAYIHLSQYFIIWNANIPEETFWYLQREAGGWWYIGLALIFGHFFIPFLLLLRIDFKLLSPLMLPLAAWAWVMHYCDVNFNVMPLQRPGGFVLSPIDLGCLAFIVGVLGLMWLREFARSAPFPQKDPRMLEALGLHHPQVSPHSVAKFEGVQ